MVQLVRGSVRLRFVGAGLRRTRRSSPDAVGTPGTGRRGARGIGGRAHGSAVGAVRRCSAGPRALRAVLPAGWLAGGSRRRSCRGSWGWASAAALTRAGARGRAPPRAAGRPRRVKDANTVADEWCWSCSRAVFFSSFAVLCLRHCPVVGASSLVAQAGRRRLVEHGWLFRVGHKQAAGKRIGCRWCRAWRRRCHPDVSSTAATQADIDAGVVVNVRST